MYTDHDGQFTLHLHSEYMKVKKAFALVIALVTICTAVFASEMSNAAVAKIISVKVKEFFTPEMIAKYVSYNKEAQRHRSPGFEGYYDQIREITFQESFGGVGTIVNNNNDGDAAWRWYSAVRLVAINHFRENLHKDSNLTDTYVASRDSFKKAFSGLDSSGKKNVSIILNNFKTGLHKAKGGKYQDVLTAYAKYYPYYDSQSQAKLDHDAAQETLTKEFGDEELATFILRRHREGGDALLTKYETLIGLIQEDVK